MHYLTTAKKQIKNCVHDKDGRMVKVLRRFEHGNSGSIMPEIV